MKWWKKLFHVVLIEIFNFVDTKNYVCLKDEKQPPEVLCKKGVLRNFAKFAGKHLCQSFFFDKVAALRSAALLKRTLWHRCFPVNFAKFLRTPFLTEHVWATASEELLWSGAVFRSNQYAVVWRCFSQFIYSFSYCLSVQMFPLD